MFFFILPTLVIIPESSPTSPSPPISLTSTSSPPPIPILSFHDTSAASLPTLSQSLDAAFTSHGFVIITNLTIPAVAPLLTSSKDFFAQTKDRKMKHNYGDYGNPSGGYTPQGTESVSQTLDAVTTTKPHVAKTGKDRVENFVFRAMYADDRDAHLHPPDLYNAAKLYFDEASDVLRLLNRLACMALGCPGGSDGASEEYLNDFFWDRTGSNFDANPGNGNSLRLSYYPPQSAPERECGAEECAASERLRYGAHTDYQTFTILLQDPRDHRDGFGGLEVLVDDAWVPVVPPEGGLPGTVSFVVNCGDLTRVLTNGRWKSNLHRVANPTSAAGWAYGRVSVPFFTGPKDDVVVHPLESTIESEGGRFYESVGAKEHLMKKLGLSNE